MSDLQTPYLQDPLPKQPACLKEGSLFRFPLRSTTEQVKASEIVNESSEPLTAEVMERNVVNGMCQIKDAYSF